LLLEPQISVGKSTGSEDG